MPQLYIVATPLGNLNDISSRALETLKIVDMILCEDTRRTQKLLSHFGIQQHTLSYHQHSKMVKIDQIITLLAQGKNMALVSDSGTPGVCDPGNYLIREITKRGISVETIPIPGPCALTALLSVCGFSVDTFLFLGFIPHKKGRETMLKKIRESNTPVVFYESPHRIMKTLSQLKALLGEERQLVVGRELTKLHETLYRGTVEEVEHALYSTSHKGEFVIIVDTNIL